MSKTSTTAIVRITRDDVVYPGLDGDFIETYHEPPNTVGVLGRVNDKPFDFELEVDQAKTLISMLQDSMAELEKEAACE